MQILKIFSRKPKEATKTEPGLKYQIIEVSPGKYIGKITERFFDGKRYIDRYGIWHCQSTASSDPFSSVDAATAAVKRHINRILKEREEERTFPRVIVEGRHP
jgi:hypothetical protein